MVEEGASHGETIQWIAQESAADQTLSSDAIEQVHVPDAEEAGS
jgi:hypothetical protein